MFYPTSRGVLKNVGGVLIDLMRLTSFHLNGDSFATCPQSPYIISRYNVWEHMEDGTFERQPALSDALETAVVSRSPIEKSEMLTATHVYYVTEEGFVSWDFKSDADVYMCDGYSHSTRHGQMACIINTPFGIQQSLMQADTTWVLANADRDVSDQYAHDGMVWCAPETELKFVCFPYAIVDDRLLAMLPGGKWLDCELKVGPGHFLYKKHDVVWLARAGTPLPGDEPPRALDFIERADACERWKRNE